ncbi:MULTISPECIES: SRPBCC family protein [Kocuria]|jgi:hypothetical protein|uniref:SRPBCC family protein n=1 Tax=Kocuria TaxID=57493 RepID=UPI00204075B7|nr:MULTISPECIES: SRPBCC family protein [Kocuria]MCM3688595.1 SRPBCC family protein [Kocuria rosea]HST71134.1 SRPBCC family protein [Kocuria rosea]
MAQGSATFRVVGSTLVAAEAGLVERFLLDPGCFAAWHRGVRGEVRASTPVLQTGTCLEFTGRYGPLRFPYVTIVSEHVPGRNVAMRTTRGLVDLFVDTRWDATDGGTRIETVLDARCTQSKAWLTPAVEATSRRNVRRNLETLKRLLETGQFEFTVPSVLTPHPPRCTQDPPPEFF